MKKKILLFTLTLMSAGALRGMEVPQDVYTTIIQQAVESSKTLDDAIQAVKIAGALRGVKYDNLKDFTKLVHILADKFNTGTYQVSKRFKTPISELYTQLVNDLFMATYLKQPGHIAKITEIIKNGADINYSIDSDSSVVLTWALTGRIDSPDIIELLFNAGLKPPHKHLQELINKLNSINTDELTRQQIKKLLEDEMKK